MLLKWDQVSEKKYETGVEKGVLYKTKEDGSYGVGVAWNGLTNVSEKPSGAEASPIYADNKKYLSLTSAEEFAATIEAYTYPDEFAECDGSAEIAPGISIGQQERKMFGFCYRTIIGNDVAKNNYGYKIHCVYGATAAPSEKGYGTVNESPEAITMSWELSTTPVEIPGFKPSATIIIDSTKVTIENMKKIEDALYGTASEEPKLLSPAELMELIGPSEPAGE